MHYIPAYLRAITQLNTGLESYPDMKASKVERVISELNTLEFRQHDEVPMWEYKEALEGKRLIKNQKKVRVSHEVDHPDRHWWIVSNGLFEDTPPRDHADIFNLLLAINLCIKEPVSFSQSPGQIIGGAFEIHNGAIDPYTNLSRRSAYMTLSTLGEMPEEVHVSGDVDRIYEMICAFRSNPIKSDEDMDIRVALHVYEDALTSSLWTLWPNLFFVCENVLCSGRRTKPVPRIVELTDMNKEQAENWKEIVNRTKHPDKGSVTGFIEQHDIKIPSPWYVRKTANSVLKYAMKERFENIE